MCAIRVELEIIIAGAASCPRYVEVVSGDSALRLHRPESNRFISRIMHVMTVRMRVLAMLTYLCCHGVLWVRGV